MSLSEEISSMKEEGIPEEEIINSLRERGIPPKEIMDTINQLKIKSAVFDSEPNEREDDLFEESYSEEVEEEEEESPPPQIPVQQEYSSQEEYDYPPTTGVDANSIIEISEQVFSEKIKGIRKDIESFNEFKNLSQIRIENLNERLKRMENVFDKLQITILEKIGSYGQNLENIKKEMEMMQNSFSKIVEPLVDNAEKKQEIRGHSSNFKKR